MRGAGAGGGYQLAGTRVSGHDGARLIRRRANLVGEQSVHVRVIGVELGVFGWNRALGRRSAGAEIIFERNVRRASRDERRDKRKDKQQSHGATGNRTTPAECAPARGATQPGPTLSILVVEALNAKTGATCLQASCPSCVGAGSA